MSAQAENSEEISLFCPAKINLFLAVLGPRSDGFHDILSVAVPLDFGDQLIIRLGSEGEADELVCDDPGLNCGPDNLVSKAIRNFRIAAGSSRAVQARLIKRIPIGAGLGGGSSNAATALNGLNRLHGFPLSKEALRNLAAGLGSDVSLFLRGEPVVMRERGERVEVLPNACVERISRLRFLLFRPEYSISTAWAYSRLAEDGARFDSAEKMEAKLFEWIESQAPPDHLLFNSFEQVIFRKFIGVRALLLRLRGDLGLPCLVSGTGSACFALIDEKNPVTKAERLVRECWGEDTFLVESGPLTLSN